MRLFIRTDQEVIQDSLRLTRPAFVQKYKDTASTEKILEEAYHQLRVHHLKTTNKPIAKNSSIPAHLRTALDPTIGDPDDAVVITDNSPDPDDYRLTKVVIEQKAETVVKKPVKEIKSSSTTPSGKKTKKERITELLDLGKQPQEIVDTLKEQGLEVRLLYVKSLIKK